MTPHGPVVGHTKARRDALPRELLALANQLEPAVAQAFLDAVNDVRVLVIDDVDPDALAARLIAAAEARLGRRLPAAIVPVFRQAGALTAAYLDRAVGGVGIRFDVANPAAVEYAETQVARRVAGISRETGDGIREAIRASQAGEVGDSRRLFERIRGLIGLRPDQADAVQRYHDDLLADGVDPVEAEGKTNRYAERQLQQRAEAIGRFETMDAANAGLMESTRQAIESGWLDASTTKLEWIATLDDKVDDDCRDLDGVTVSWGEPFPGGIERPPLHGNCRCVLGVRPPSAEEIQAAQGEPEERSFHEPVTPPKEPEPMAPHYLHALVKAVEPRERRIDFVASHEFVDRQGDVIEVAFLDLAEYRRNPILLRDHDLRQPVGVVDRLRIENRSGAAALVGSALIGDDDMGAYVAETWSAIQRGVLRGISVGFQPLASEPLDRSGGLRFTRSRLLEISVVSIPACASCLIERKALARHDEIDASPEEVRAMVARTLPGVVKAALDRARCALTGELD